MTAFSTLLASCVMLTVPGSATKPCKKSWIQSCFSSEMAREKKPITTVPLNVRVPKLPEDKDYQFKEGELVMGWYEVNGENHEFLAFYVGTSGEGKSMKTHVRFFDSKCSFAKAIPATNVRPVCIGEFWVTARYRRLCHSRELKYDLEPEDKEIWSDPVLDDLLDALKYGQLHCHEWQDEDSSKNIDVGKLNKIMSGCRDFLIYYIAQLMDEYPEVLCKDTIEELVIEGLMFNSHNVKWLSLTSKMTKLNVPEPRSNLQIVRNMLLELSNEKNPYDPPAEEEKAMEEPAPEHLVSKVWNEGRLSKVRNAKIKDRRRTNRLRRRWGKSWKKFLKRNKNFTKEI